MTKHLDFIAVAIVDRDRWARMYAAARQRGLRLRPADAGANVTAFEVESLTARNQGRVGWHLVVIAQTADGVHVSCDCEFFSLRHAACTHAAWALHQANAFPFDLGPVEPCPMCGALFDDAAQVKRHIKLAHSSPPKARVLPATNPLLQRGGG